MSVSDLIRQFSGADETTLNDIESKQLLKELGIPFVEAALADSADAAAASASAGSPVHLKPLSGSSDHGWSPALSGPALTSQEDVKSAYQAMSKNGDGVAVQKAVRPGVELSISIQQDILFERVLAMGYGKLAVEVLEDVAYRIVPLTEKDARLMVREPKGSRLLDGFGPLEPPDIVAIQDLLMKLSRFAAETPQVLALALDPVYAYGDGLAVLDARITLR
jgi:acyl-CoA synthetase (NDP forming)